MSTASESIASEHTQPLVLLFGDAPNHRALANKIAKKLPVDAVVIEQRKRGSKRTFRQLAERVYQKLRFGKIDQAWANMQAKMTEDYPNWPDVPQIRVNNVNAPAVREHLQQLAPGMMMVSGTRIVRKPILELAPPRGILNLHTGLSPYVKGGPNCTNWCIAERRFHLIGNTIMWIDAGIDTGNLIATEATPLQVGWSLSDLHIAVMEHAHELYVRAAKAVWQGQQVPNVPQSAIAQGHTYYTRQWTNAKRAEMLRNWPKLKSELHTKAFKEAQGSLHLISLVEAA